MIAQLQTVLAYSGVRPTLLPSEHSRETLLAEIIVMLNGVAVRLQVAGTPQTPRLTEHEAAILSPSAIAAIEASVLPEFASRYPAALRAAEEADTWWRRWRSGDRVPSHETQ